MRYCKTNLLLIGGIAVLCLLANGCGGRIVPVRALESEPLLIKGQVKAGFKSIGQLDYSRKLRQKQKKEKLVDRIVAVPVRHGGFDQESIKHGIAVALQANGAFQIKAHKGYDWVLILQNSVADGIKQFVGQIAMPLDHSKETLLLLPATKLYEKVAEIDLGDIKLQGKQILASRKMRISDFSITAKDLIAIAAHDEPLAGIANIIFKSGGSIFHTLRTDFKWTGLYQSMDGEYSHPYFTGYEGYNFQLDTNSSAVSMDEICGAGGTTRKEVALFPPAGCLVEADRHSRVYSSVSPIANDAATCSLAADGATEARDDDFYAANRYAKISFTFGRLLQTDPIPGGLWDYKIDGATQAQFDPSVAIPRTSDNKIDGLAPRLRANHDASGRITSFEITWMVRDETAYGSYDVAPETAVVTLVSGGDIFLENQSGAARRYESIHYEPAAYTVVAPVNEWYFGNDGSPEQQAEAIGIHWASGATGYFIQYPRYIGPAGEVSLVLPIPVLERTAITRGQSYNLKAEHDGLDFGFSDWPTGDTAGYVLHDIVAPCNGVIREISQHPISGSGNEAYSIIIKYNQTRSILLCFEPDTTNLGLVNQQGREIVVSFGQVVHQGELIGRLVTSAPPSSRLFGPHVHWAVYETTSLGETIRPICPQSLCTAEEATALESIYRSLPGGALLVCVR